MLGNTLSKLLFWLAIAVCLVTFGGIVIPLAIVVITGFLSAPLGAGGHFTLDQYAYVLTDPTALPALTTTLLFALGSTVIAVGLAAFFAWGVAFLDLPFKRWLRITPLAVMVLPTLLKDPAWIELYSPKIGLINLAAKALGAPGPLFNIYTLGGMIVLVGLNTMPIAYTILLAPFESFDQAFEEASRMSGAGARHTTTHVVIPILVPALLSAIALTMILVASSFETPVLVGLPGGVITYVSEIYTSVTGAVDANLNQGAAASSVYLVLTGALLAWYMLATRHERRFISISSKARTRRREASKLVRALFVTAFALYFVVTFVMPFCMTLLVSFLPYYSVAGGNPLRPGFSLRNYIEIATEPQVIQAFATSLWVSALAVVLTLPIATGLSYVAFKTRLRGRRLVELLGTLPISVPAVVFGLALLITFVSLPGIRIFYNTYVPMIFAEVVVFLPFAIRVISAALIQIEDSLLEAGVMSGASRGRVLRDILLPLLSRALRNAGALVFILSFRELGAVVLLVAANTVLIPTVTFNFWVTADLGAVAALNLVTLVVPAAAIGIVYALGRGVIVIFNRYQAVPILPAPLRPRQA